MNVSLAAEPIIHLGGVPITNTLIIGWIIVALTSIFAIIFSTRIKEVPSRLQALIEFGLEALLKLADDVTGDRKWSKRFFPLVATIFIFVLLANWIEIVPGLGTIGIKEVVHGQTEIIPFIRSTSADLNFTLAIAILAVLSVQIFGIAGQGFFKYLSKFINFKNPIFFFVGILEIFAEIARVVSFSFRLFGNIFAGEVLLMTMLFLVPYFVPLPFLLLEIFVGVVQALIFSMLTLIFLKMAVSSHEEH